MGLDVSILKLSNPKDLEIVEQANIIDIKRFISGDIYDEIDEYSLFEDDNGELYTYDEKGEIYYPNLKKVWDYFNSDYGTPIIKHENINYMRKNWGLHSYMTEKYFQTYNIVGADLENYKKNNHWPCFIFNLTSDILQQLYQDLKSGVYYEADLGRYNFAISPVNQYSRENLSGYEIKENDIAYVKDLLKQVNMGQVILYSGT